MVSPFLSRRQFFKHGRSAIAALTTFTLAHWIHQPSQARLRQSDPIADLETQIPRLMQQSRVPGLAIAIVKNGELLWSQGFGRRNHKQPYPVDNRTIFAAASLGKPLFAYTVLKLVEQGQLDLDVPLTAYTAKPYIKDSRIEQITARTVLCHTTGFPNWSGSAPVWIQATPGTRFGYSGEGYLYLQRVVERITGQPLAPYIRQNTLVPLRMSDSSYIWETRYQDVATAGHNRQSHPSPMGRPKTALSAGSLRTTASDFARFLIAMMTEGTPESPYLTTATLAEMLRPQIVLSLSLSWGLGWGLEQTPDGPFFWHWGDSGSFKSFTAASRSLKTGIVILTNSANGLRICPTIVRLAIGGQHPAFGLKMIRY